jgi:hypothetical protein
MGKWLYAFTIRDGFENGVSFGFGKTKQKAACF